MDHRARDSWIKEGGREGKKGMHEVSEIFLISNNAKANRCHFSTSQSQSQSSLTLTLTLASVVAAVLQHVHSQRQPRARARRGGETDKAFSASFPQLNPQWDQGIFGSAN